MKLTATSRGQSFGRNRCDQNSPFVFTSLPFGLATDSATCIYQSFTDPHKTLEDSRNTCCFVSGWWICGCFISASYVFFSNNYKEWPGQVWFFLLTRRKVNWIHTKWESFWVTLLTWRMVSFQSHRRKWTAYRFSYMIFVVNINVCQLVQLPELLELLFRWA